MLGVDVGHIPCLSRHTRITATRHRVTHKPVTTSTQRVRVRTTSTRDSTYTSDNVLIVSLSVGAGYFGITIVILGIMFTLYVRYKNELNLVINGLRRSILHDDDATNGLHDDADMELHNRNINNTTDDAAVIDIN